MDVLKKISSKTNNSKSSAYDFFFDRIDYCLNKGRGFSLFNADEDSITSFLEQCNHKACSPLVVRLSAIENSPLDMLDPQKFVVIVQDLAYPEFFERASTDRGQVGLSPLVQTYLDLFFLLSGTGRVRASAGQRGRPPQEFFAGDLFPSGRTDFYLAGPLKLSICLTGFSKLITA